MAKINNFLALTLVAAAASGGCSPENASSYDANKPVEATPAGALSYCSSQSFDKKVVSIPTFDMWKLLHRNGLLRFSNDNVSETSEEYVLTFNPPGIAVVSIENPQTDSERIRLKSLRNDEFYTVRAKFRCIEMPINSQSKDDVRIFKVTDTDGATRILEVATPQIGTIKEQ